MKKILGVIFLSVFVNSIATAGCGLGWFTASIFDNTKEHKICSNFAKSFEGDSFQKDDAYCDCRERLLIESSGDR